MDSQTKLLLEKYWRAETTVEEERLLKMQLGSLDEKNSETSYFKAIDKRQQVISKTTFQHPAKRTYYWWASVAAVLVIGIFVIVGLSQRQGSRSEYAIQDPEMAMEVTRNALLLVSNGLNEGKNLSTYQLNQINKPKDIISNKNNSN